MTALDFLSVRSAPDDRFQPRRRSPLERALRARYAHGIHDRSLELTILEVRGDLDRIAGELIRLGPRRALLIADDGEEPRPGTIDVTAALAVLRIERPDAAELLRRLTDLDLDELPAVGGVARVPAIVRKDGDAFELFWPQEYGHYLAEVVLDAAEGLG